MDALLPLCAPLQPSHSPRALLTPALPDAIFLYILITLTTRARVLGHPYAWAEPIIELPWFNQWPGYPEGQYPSMGMGMGMGAPGMYPGMGTYPGAMVPYGYAAGQPMAYPAPGPAPLAVAGTAQSGYVVQQTPGHSIVIQTGANGQAPTITQVPGSVTSI